MNSTIVVNQEALEKLPPATQKIIRDAGADAANWATIEMKRVEDEDTARFGKEGMVLTAASPEDVKEATDKLRPYWDEWASKHSAEAVAILKEIRAAQFAADHGRSTTIPEFPGEAKEKPRSIPCPPGWNAAACWICEIGIVAIAVVVLTEIVTRNLFSFSFEASEELGGYIVVGIAFLLACRCVRSTGRTTTSSSCRSDSVAAIAARHRTCVFDVRSSLGFCLLLVWQLSRFVLHRPGIGPRMWRQPCSPHRYAIPQTLDAAWCAGRVSVADTRADRQYPEIPSGGTLNDGTRISVDLLVWRFPAAAGRRHGGALRHRVVPGVLYLLMRARPDRDQRHRPGHLG